MAIAVTAQGTYRAQGIVLRRTKLGETDLIVTLLCAEYDQQVRAVAKDARKPGSRLAGVVDLGNEGSFLLRRGRNLDRISEGRLLTSRTGLALDVDRSAFAAAVLDSAADLTAEGEHDQRLYPLTDAALGAVAHCDRVRLPLVVAAYLLKAAAMQGYRPELDACVRCSEPVDLAGAAAEGRPVRFTPLEGGVVCDGCADSQAGSYVDAGLLLWVQALIGSRFSDLLMMGLPGEDGGACLGGDLLLFARTWLEYYPGVRPKALDFVLSGALW